MRRIDELRYLLFFALLLLASLLVFFQLKDKDELIHSKNRYDVYCPKEVTYMQRSVEKSWENCLRKLRLQYDVVFYGNSITRNSDFCKFFPNHSICNLGHGGDDLDGMVRRVGMAACLEPKKIFVMAGINDLADRISYEQFEKKYGLLVKTIEDSIPNATIYLQSILPISKLKMEIFGTNQRIDSINKIIFKIAEERKHIFIDLFSQYLVDGELPHSFSNDGLHINDDSYEIWAETITPFMNE